VPLDLPRHYNPVEANTKLGTILNRLVLHLSIGQAY
jgi:hypothetical protein